ncbi:hypothetical protein BDW74DRAFT_156748 [Aspergillus multicolor]|uniref:uncharacterized protein n=1 Tax=Aspergillus multicolor TaxID=41759 RepID=UPI003CCD9F71
MATSTATAYTSTTLVSVPRGPGLEKNCPTCGQAPESQSHPAELTRRRVKDLEQHVQFLNEQAAQMSEKLLGYEAEMRRLRAQPAPPRSSTFPLRNGRSISSTSTSSHSPSNSNSISQSPPQQVVQPTQSRLSSLASLLPYRRPSTASSQPQSQPPPSPGLKQCQPMPFTQSPPPMEPRTPTPRPSTEETLELQNALSREQSLRKAAETQLTQASSELEELTAQLFSQANEMVAQERKARARLEERVAVLERRDVEKRNRLERLEKAMERVERIRALVG